MIDKNISDLENLEEHFELKGTLDDVLSLYSVSRVFVYPIVDVLKLILQRSAIISFFEKGRNNHNNLIYTSFKDQDLLRRDPTFLSQLTASKGKIVISDDISMSVCASTAIPGASMNQTGKMIEISDLQQDDFNELKQITEALILRSDNDARYRKEKIVRALKYYEDCFGRDDLLIEKLKNLQVDSPRPKEKDTGWIPTDYLFFDFERMVQQGLIREGRIPFGEHDFFENMQRVVDLSMDDYLEADLIGLNTDRTALDFSNLFFVIRFPRRRTAFDYSATVMLSSLQREKIREWWSKKYLTYNFSHLETLFGNANKSSVNLRGIIKDFVTGFEHWSSRLTDFIETPLSRDARSIADSVFASGVIDFSAFSAGTGPDWSGYSVFDVQRQMAEHIIYSKITRFRRPFYIPIHVGGAPWIILFTMAPQKSKSQTHADKLHNIRMYRLLIPHIGNKIRASVRQLYLSKFTEIVANVIEELFDPDPPNLDGLCRHLSLSLTFLSRFFPYDGLVFYDYPKSDCRPLSLPNNRKVWLDSYPNPYFIAQVDFDLIDLDSLINATKNGIQRATIKHQQSVEQLNARLRAQEHTIFNALPNRELELATSADENELSGDARKWAVDARRALDIVTASLNITFRPDEYRIPSSDTNTVLKLIKWFEERILSSEMRPSISMANQISDVALEGKSRQHAFTIIWNLWNNAIKNLRNDRQGKDFFNIKIHSDERSLCIDFENGGEIPNSWLMYINGEGY